LNVLDLQRLIRSMPKVVIALVAGYAIGGDMSHLICDLTIADNVFWSNRSQSWQLDGLVPAICPDCRSREIWSSLPLYCSAGAGNGFVNCVVPVEQLEQEGQLTKF